MVSHHDPFLKRVTIPIGARHGRQVGRRDKLLAIAFGAVLLLAFWWMWLRPADYTITEGDITGITRTGYPDRLNRYVDVAYDGEMKEVNYVELTGDPELSPIKVFFVESTGGGGLELIRELAVQAQGELLLDAEGRYPDAKRKEFSKAIVVCADPDDCSRIARDSIRNARNR